MQQELQSIKERNDRVELDKKWETSVTRRVLIAGVTYVVAVLFMHRMGLNQPLVNALVPTGGYLLSTTSLPFVKKIWMRRYKK